MWRQRFNFFVAVLVLAGLGAGCGTPKPAATPKPVVPFLQAFQVQGVIKELPPEGRSVVIRHEEIPGYMAAMVMPFTVRDPKELAGLAVGDTVTFQMVVSADDGWIERVVKLAGLPAPAATTNAPALPVGLRVVRDVTPLQEGDLLPDYTFTNQLGRAVRFADYRGQALAITFIFTRCPFPTFCPRMSLNFVEAQQQLKAPPVTATNWQLFTLSFDPEYDTPAVLKEYAERYGHDPAHWSFLTGDRTEIAAITEQFEVQFWRENPAEPISHNLRTVVVNAQGRVQKILANNNWKSAELVTEMLKAAAAKP